MNKTILTFILFGLTTLLSISALSQASCNFLQVTHPAMANNSYSSSHWFGIMELPFLLISVFFAFATAYQLKGGRFGKGMRLLAWGFLVMAVGHLHMQIEHFYGVNIFTSILGETGGFVAWFLALIATWGMSGLGFYFIYKASKG